jgi:hypothetical protein
MNARIARNNVVMGFQLKRYWWGQPWYANRVVARGRICWKEALQ